jgi:hypothetical protein
VFAEGEVDRASTVAFFATVQSEADRQVTRQVEHFNFDAILSVGYRVNSRRGTQFRIWASRALRDHLLKGYSVNERRLRELRQSLRLVGQVLDKGKVSADQATALLRVITDYDHQRVAPSPTYRGQAIGISYEEAIEIIGELRAKFGASTLRPRERRQPA